MKILNYFLVLLIPTLLNSQNINNPTPTSKFKIGLEIGHFSPKKESFKENYDQAIYGIPFSAIDFKKLFYNKKIEILYDEIEILPNHFFLID